MLQKHGSKTPNVVEETVTSSSADLHYGLMWINFAGEERCKARKGYASMEKTRCPAKPWLSGCPKDGPHCGGERPTSLVSLTGGVIHQGEGLSVLSKELAVEYRLLLLPFIFILKIF